MLPVARDEPSLTLVGDYFFEYGSILLDFHNAITEAVALDEVGRYAVVLKFDGDLRATTAAIVPKFLSPKTPLETAWPSWVKWAR